MKLYSTDCILTIDFVTNCYQLSKRLSRHQLFLSFFVVVNIVSQTSDLLFIHKLTAGGVTFFFFGSIIHICSVRLYRPPISRGLPHFCNNAARYLHINESTTCSEPISMSIVWNCLLSQCTMARGCVVESLF